MDPLSTKIYDSAWRPVVLNSQTSRIKHSVHRSRSVPERVAGEWSAKYGTMREYGVRGLRMKRSGLILSVGLIVLVLVSIQAVAATAQVSDPIPTWAKTYHATGAAETANSMQQTADGGYIVAGSTNSSGVPGHPHAWVLKLDSLGNVLWQKTYGGNGPDGACSVQQTSDGGFMVAGSVKECCFGNADNWDALIFKLNATGGVVWQRTYGGPDVDEAHSIQLTSDGGFIVAGDASGWGAQGNCIFPCPHAWIFKMDALGNVIWQKSYGGTIIDHANSVDQTSNGGYIVVGSTGSPGGAWVFRLDSIGNIVWERGGSSAASVHQTSDGGFVAAGPSSSYASMGAVVVKLDSNGNIGLGCPFTGPSNSTAADTNATITTASLVVNATGATVATSNATVTDTSELTSVQCASNEPPDFSMSANPSSLTVKQGGSDTTH